MARGIGEIDPELPRRLGVLGLDGVWERLDPKHEALRNAFWYARQGMMRALELHLLNGGSADVVVSRLETPASVLARVAAITK
jgi:hypothetical protein